MGTGPENHSREARQAKVTALGRAYADALLAADEGAAEIAIREAMDAGLDTAGIDDEIIAPAMWRIGDLWERGEISVADEHISVTMLGSDVPGDDLIAVLHRRPPDVVCLTSTMPDAAAELLGIIGALQRHWPGMGFVIGGSGLTSRVHSRPGIDVCRRVSEAVEAVDAMVKGASRN